MTSSTNEPIDFISTGQQQRRASAVMSAPTDLIQSLLHEIIRVKEIIRHYERIPNGTGQRGASILKELIAEAHDSMVNYDLMLMRKYFDLLQHCD